MKSAYNYIKYEFTNFSSPSPQRGEGEEKGGEGEEEGGEGGEKGGEEGEGGEGGEGEEVKFEDSLEEITQLTKFIYISSHRQRAKERLFFCCWVV